MAEAYRYEESWDGHYEIPEVIAVLFPSEKLKVILSNGDVKTERKEFSNLINSHIDYLRKSGKQSYEGGPNDRVYVRLDKLEREEADRILKFARIEEGKKTLERVLSERYVSMRRGNSDAVQQDAPVDSWGSSIG